MPDLTEIFSHPGLLRSLVDRFLPRRQIDLTDVLADPLLLAGLTNLLLPAKPRRRGLWLGPR